MTVATTDDLCVVYLPDMGWTFFSWDGSAWSSVDLEGKDLPVYRYTNESVKTTTGETDVVNPLKIPADRIGFYHSHLVNRSNSPHASTLAEDQIRNGASDSCPFQQNISTIVKDPLLSPFPVSYFKRIPSGSNEMQMLLDSQIATALYDSINSVLPSAMSAASLLNAVLSVGTNIQKSILQKTESCLQLQQYIQEYVATMSNLALLKILQNPAFSAMIGIAMALFAVAAVLFSLAGATFGISVAIAVICLVAAILLITYIVELSLAYASDHKNLANLRDAHGKGTEFYKYYDSALKNLTIAFAVFVGVLLLTVALSFVCAYFFVTPSTTTVSEIVARMVMSVAGAVSANATETSAIGQIYNGYMQKDNAEMIYDYTLKNAKMQQWEAESSYFSAMQDRISQSVKNIWDYIEQLYKTQSDLIKTLSDGSLAITRCIVI